MLCQRQTCTRQTNEVGHSPVPRSPVPSPKKHSPLRSNCDARCGIIAARAAPTLQEFLIGLADAACPVVSSGVLNLEDGVRFSVAGRKTSDSNCQHAEGAPLILTATSYSQGEAHCTFDSVSQDSGGWLAKAKCSVEGEDQEGTFTFVVEGDKLTIRDDSGERSLLRCP
jgi:hypothetical protein